MYQHIILIFIHYKTLLAVTLSGMNQTPSPATRWASVDALRALTMLLMIFVNDLWSLRDIPGWLEHTQAQEDGMGLADTVFPAFLFIVGMSIPLAVRHRISKGDTVPALLWHIAGRSLALLVMGLFLVNGEYINPIATGMSRGAWNSICCTCFILIWNSWPATVPAWLKISLRLIGIVVLGWMAWCFRSGEAGEQRFATHWWGILGLIGWAYLVSAVVYVLARRNAWVLLGAWLFFLVNCILGHSGSLSTLPWWETLLSPLGGGAMPALVLGGVLLTTILLQYTAKKEPIKLIGIILTIAVLLIAAGFALRPAWGISKIGATPAWVLICSGITVGVFALVYWITDLKQINWWGFMRPAGTQTLLCYLMPYYAYALIPVLGISLPAVLLTGGIGLIKSLAFSLLMIAIAGMLGKMGVKVKL